MTELRFEPFAIGDNTIDSVVLKAISFPKLVSYYSWARNARGLSLDAAVMRLRLHQQVEYRSGDSAVKLTIDQITAIPSPVARQIIAKLDDLCGVAGKIVQEGDGASSPVIYKLGTAIDDVTNLAFIARTYGDLEAIATIDDPLEQTITLVRKILTPEQTDQLSIADGVTIATIVLPKFLVE